MNEFDRSLEAELRHMLDPVVAVQPPLRGGLKRSRKPILVVVAPALELAADAIPAVEPVPVTVAVAPGQTL